MQAAALGAVQSYAQSHSYQLKSPSFELLDRSDTNATVHATVSFQTAAGAAFEDNDALIVLTKSAGAWQAAPISQFTKLDLEVSLDPGPLQLKSAAGFVVNVPQGFGGYIAPQSQFTSAQACGTGDNASTTVQLLIIMPRGYSTQNVPVVMRAYQQCPLASSLEVIRQRLDSLRTGDKTLRWDRLELIQLSGQQLLSAAVVDTVYGSVVYDFYLIYRGRQIEFVIQAIADRMCSR